MSRLEGKIAFITGAGGGGQGRAAALRFAAEGAVVIGCDLDAAALDETRRAVAAAGGTMLAGAAFDLADRDAVAGWVADGVAAAGGIDILYSNAGAVRFGGLGELAQEDWAFTIRNELDQVFTVTRAAWPHLEARGGGSIIITSSGSALRGNAQIGAIAHASAKAGLYGFTRQAAAEGCKLGIRVNSISPGAIETPQSRAALPPAIFDRIAQSIPMGCWGRPEDVVHFAVYLASDESRWVTGTDFVIDGGVNAVR